MLAGLILIPATFALAVGFWRAGRARGLRWFANGLVLILTGSVGLAVSLLATILEGV